MLLKQHDYSTRQTHRCGMSERACRCARPCARILNSKKETVFFWEHKETCSVCKHRMKRDQENAFSDTVERARDWCVRYQILVANYETAYGDLNKTRSLDQEVRVLLQEKQHVMGSGSIRCRCKWEKVTEEAILEGYTCQNVYIQHHKKRCQKYTFWHVFLWCLSFHVVSSRLLLGL